MEYSTVIALTIGVLATSSKKVTEFFFIKIQFQHLLGPIWKDKNLQISLQENP